MSRGNRQRQKFDQTAAALELRYGPGVIRRANEIVHEVPHLSTGFSTLDALTGCNGVPLGHMTLLSGVYTSGKETIAYKTIAAAQKIYPQQAVAVVSLHGYTDPDYLRRAGVRLERVLFIEPQVQYHALDRQTIDVLVDLANDPSVLLILFNCLADIQKEPLLYRHLTANLGRLQQALYSTKGALLWIDDPAPPWQRFWNRDASSAVRQYAALHIEVQLEQLLLDEAGELYGYSSIAKLHKSRWTKSGRTMPVNIEFNGTIRARETW
jgi:recombination protein RecA